MVDGFNLQPSTFNLTVRLAAWMGTLKAKKLTFAPHIKKSFHEFI
jgi:hypothetical protein